MHQDGEGAITPRTHSGLNRGGLRGSSARRGPKSLALLQHTPPPAPVDRSGCEGRRHGTESAYNNYRCTCPDAVRDRRTKRKLRAARLLPAGLVPSVGTQRRLQALAWMGHSARSIAKALGKTERDVLYWRSGRCQQIIRANADLVTELYERWWNVPGPWVSTTAFARAAGFRPPLAWDDETIDQPDVELVDPPQDVDDAVWCPLDLVLVEKVEVEPTKTTLTREQQVWMVGYLTLRGWTASAIGEQLGLLVRQVQRYRAEVRRHVAELDERRDRGVASGDAVIKLAVLRPQPTVGSPDAVGVDSPE